METVNKAESILGRLTERFVAMYWIRQKRLILTRYEVTPLQVSLDQKISGIYRV